MLQPKLTKVEPVKPLKLCLYYETGEVKLFDAAPYATGSWYGRLQDERYFATVHLLPGGIGIEWPELKGEYKGSASAEGYTLEDGTALNLSGKDQKWLGLKDTFKF